MKKQEQLRKGVYILPSPFTVSNLFFGFTSLVCAQKGSYAMGAVSIFIAAMLDALDGRIARLTGTESEFGAELDYIVDIVSFGVAPAFLVYHWAFTSADVMAYPLLRRLGWAAAFLAFLPGLSFAGVVWVFGGLIIEEADEFYRMLYGCQGLIATGSGRSRPALTLLVNNRVVRDRLLVGAADPDSHVHAPADLGRIVAVADPDPGRRTRFAVGPVGRRAGRAASDHPRSRSVASSRCGISDPCGPGHRSCPDRNRCPGRRACAPSCCPRRGGDHSVSLSYFPMFRFAVDADQASSTRTM